MINICILNIIYQPSVFEYILSITGPSLRILFNWLYFGDQWSFYVVSRMTEVKGQTSNFRGILVKFGKKLPLH